jgi:hypothetical protein
MLYGSIYEQYDGTEKIGYIQKKIVLKKLLVLHMMYVLKAK